MRFGQILLAIVSVFSVFAVVLFVPPTTALAGSLSCSTTDFAVTVGVTHANGRSTYVYNITQITTPPKNPSKFFMYTRRDLDFPATGDFRFHCAGGSFGAPNCSGGYRANGAGLTGGPVGDAWKYNALNDGLEIISIAVGNFPITIDVIERETQGLHEGEDETTLLLPVGNNLQACGPIEGPMTPVKGSLNFEGNPTVLSIVEQTFANGCKYKISSNPLTNVITAMEPVPLSSCGDGSTPPCGPGVDECIVTPPVMGDECENDTGLVFCPPGRIGQPPIQHLPGGTCYYGDIKYTC